MYILAICGYTHIAIQCIYIYWQMNYIYIPSYIYVYTGFLLELPAAVVRSPEHHDLGASAADEE